MESRDFTPWPRAVLHADMDAFYASVEQLDHPEWRGKPLIVAGRPEDRGVVSAASYEVRPYGVRSAMPTARALRLCPKAILVPPRMERYEEVSDQVFDIFRRVTPLVEPVSLDEAFLDVTGSQRLHGPPETMARRLKLTVKKETSLTVSVGVAANKFTAKIASDLEKPDGLVVIRPEEVARRLAPLPVGRLWGVGPKTASRLERLGIRLVGDLTAWPQETLEEALGSQGPELLRLARGLDDSPVVADAEAKSLSRECTFAADVLSLAELDRELLRQSDSVMRRMRARGLAGKTVTLKLRYQDFTTLTRRRTLAEPVSTARTLYAAARELLRDRTEAGRRPVRLIGMGLSGLRPGEDGAHEGAERQASLFEPAPEEEARRRRTEKTEKSERAAERIREKLGAGAITRAVLLDTQ